MTFLVRNASPQDLVGLQQLYVHLNSPEPVPQDRAAAILEQLHRYEGSALLLGLVGETIVTSCTLVVIPNLTRSGTPYALIENVVTHEDHRGHGHATAILHEAVRRAFEVGCYKVMLLSGSKNPATPRFYEKAGFEQSKTGFQIRALPARQD